MKIITNLILGFLIVLVAEQHVAFCQPLLTNQKMNVLFQLVSPNLSNDTAVFITGNHPLLGNWNPSKIQMINNGNHVWTYTLEMERAYEFEYKYTLGSWETEGAYADGSPLPNFKASIQKSISIVDSISNWKKPGIRKLNGQITGTVKYHPQITGFGLEPRDVIVWLPPGYDDASDKKYPVLYMHDGQNIIDPATSAFGTDWQIDETCDSLIRNQLIEPLIVVGIYNTSQRSHEYIPNDTSKRYMQLITQTIKPIIDKNYHTLSDREYTFVGGSSAGGIISFMLCWEYPEIFSKAICFSPAFKIGRIDYVKNVESYSGKKKDLLFYIYNGGLDLEKLLQPGIDDMLKALNTKEYKENVDYIWKLNPDATHNESDWAKEFPTAINWIMKDISIKKLKK